MVLEKVVEIIKEELDISKEINLDTNLKNDLGADSMDAVQVVMEIEKTFNVEISDEVLASFETVKDIVEYLEKNK